MQKIKLIILGVMLNLIAAYPFDPLAVPPAITTITGITETGFTVNWHPGTISGLNTNEYYLRYVVSISGGKTISTMDCGASFSGLEPSTVYIITLETYAVMMTPTFPPMFPTMTASVRTAEEAIPEVKQVSTDYTQQSPKRVLVQAKSLIIFTNGFHYKATDGNFLKTLLSPNAKSNSPIKGYTVYPECCYLDVNGQKIDLNSNQVAFDYEITQPQQGCLLIRDKNFGYSVNVKSVYYEIVEMNSGKMCKKGNLSSYETQIDVSNLRNGFHIVKVSNGNQIYTQKIVIRN